MNRIAEFEKVSLEQFKEDWQKSVGEESAQEVYEGLKLPLRATAGSAGYDFFAPVDIEIAPEEEVIIATGIRVKMEPGWVLLLVPRSGLGFRYRLQLNNTVGVIDGDYYNAENEGHILVRMTNDTHGSRKVMINKGDGMLQGIFVPYGITVDDAAEGVRAGGFGSTTENKQDD